ncbi:hypothetical protein LTS18_003519 [Coniosporium uncinatum]|uniref:Uncharacterized protein n=1 Tax=Coniosporium uncinatum TaxID=93489 RepID=A0ACC3DY64_9PEZI|nr:hypothetical protein LTS18_003519 [Coniosporium uncinatum]
MLDFLLRTPHSPRSARLLHRTPTPYAIPRPDSPTPYTSLDDEDDDDDNRYLSAAYRPPTPFPTQRYPTAPYGPNSWYDDDEISFLDLDSHVQAPESGMPTLRMDSRSSRSPTVSDESAVLGGPLRRVSAAPAAAVTAAASERSVASSAASTIRGAFLGLRKKIGGVVGWGRK